MTNEERADVQVDVSEGNYLRELLDNYAAAKRAYYEAGTDDFTAATAAVDRMLTAADLVAHIVGVRVYGDQWEELNGSKAFVARVRAGALALRQPPCGRSTAPTRRREPMVPRPWTSAAWRHTEMATAANTTSVRDAGREAELVEESRAIIAGRTMLMATNRHLLACVMTMDDARESARLATEALVARDAELTRLTDQLTAERTRRLELEQQIEAMDREVAECVFAVSRLSNLSHDAKRLMAEPMTLRRAQDGAGA